MSWWSWILEGIGLTGAAVIGTKRWWGWAILFTNAGLWVAYGITSKQYGFAAASLFYGPIYGRNAIRWWRQDQEEHEQQAI